MTTIKYNFLGRGIDTTYGVATTKDNKERHGWVKPKDRKEIWELWLDGVDAKEIASQYGISRQTVFGICRRYRDALGVPKSIGYKKVRKFLNKKKNPYHQIKMPVDSANVVTFSSAITKDITTAHQHALRHNGDKNIVFCTECGDRWLKE
jgi:hypothetical protein